MKKTLGSLSKPRKQKHERGEVEYAKSAIIGKPNSPNADNSYQKCFVMHVAWRHVALAGHILTQLE